MLLKSWSQGTAFRFAEVGDLVLEEIIPFDPWIEGQNCASVSFPSLAVLWEFLVYVGNWH